MHLINTLVIVGKIALSMACMPAQHIPGNYNVQYDSMSHVQIGFHCIEEDISLNYFAYSNSGFIYHLDF